MLKSTAQVQHSKLEQTESTHCSFVQVPQGDAGGPLVLVVVGQHQVGASVGNSCSVETQQWCFILQGVEMFLWNYAEDIEVVSKIAAHHHLSKKEESFRFLTTQQKLTM